jgi:hypothetical protein
MSRRRPLRTVHAVAGLLAAMGFTGLVGVLVGGGAYDGLSWLSLGGLVAVAAWAVAGRRRP